MSHTFKRLLKQLKPDYIQVKALAVKWRSILFRDNRLLYTETPMDHREMYAAISEEYTLQKEE